ncbi:MAG: hybrid sensor histidine kinase/response regulator [Candidatus Omnitrophica bacterium]|nr:hybrid sensor histidine kinase/response regulator [Candidatus Omnitrophota bacterium]
MKKRILVVDDSFLVREMYKAQLEEADYEVLTAVDGIEAINTTFTHLPDLVLLDVHMPKINGYQVCRLLKDHSTTKEIPIIIMTGRGAGGVIEDPRKWSFQTGADGFYGKDEGTALIPAVVLYLQKVPARGKSQAAGRAKTLSETEIMLALSELLDRQLYLDITRLKELDEKKDAFVANVSHELKSPLAILKGFLDNMQDGFYGPVTSKQIETMGTMQRTINRLTRLIKDILDASKIAAGKMQLEIQTVDLRGILESTFESFKEEAAKKKLEFKLELPEIPVSISADEDRLTQVFVNLISNAIKYTPEGRAVTVRVLEEQKDGCARVEIEDTGKGIPEDQREKIFDKFTRIMAEKQEGTGLGLPIAKDLVVLHGGKVWVEPVSPTGSRFVVLLPKKKS